MIDPESVTGEPRPIVFGVESSEIVVAGLVNVVRLVEILVLVRV
jgi:hypothetical protein